MTLAQSKLLIATLILLCGGAAFAADAPAADDKKEDKPTAAAEPELPSKPYPKNASPKAFAPRGEPKNTEAIAAAAADKPTDKRPEAKAEKHEPGHDKPATGKRRQAAAPTAAPKPVKDPMLAAVAGEVLAQDKAGGSYQVKSGERLDAVIRKTMPDSPFSMEVMREAFARANPQLLAGMRNLRLKSGTTLKLPSADELRLVVLGNAPVSSEPPATKPVDLHAVAPVVSPTMHAADTERNLPLTEPRQVIEPSPAVAESPADVQRRWVRYP